MPTKILAIDDSKTMRLAIKITFAAEDADVTSVSKGSEAIARAKQMGADVVLVDADLAAGEPSGYDVCKALKADADTSGIPVLMLVSNQKGVDQSKLKGAGADGWIAKPFDTQELLDKVSAATGKPLSQAVASGRAPSRSAPTVTKPAAAATPRPASRPSVAPVAASGPNPAVKVAPAPSPRSAVSQPMTPARPAMPTTGANIPIAIPIPFTSADAPTPGMLERLRQAGGSNGSGPSLDPSVAEALVALSREVVEQVVWEVVPDLAEEILKKRAEALAG
jgi:CheY-like chemotaxis protein